MDNKNVILIMTDDQTVNTINSLGNEQVITPNLDKLRKRGMAFDNCHICGGTSGAICMPSRAITNTSKNMFSLTEAGHRISADSPLLGEELQKAGYNTFFTGKWHNGTEAFKRSFNSGDNIFFGGMWDHYNVPMNIYDPSGEYDNHVNYVVNFFNTNEVLEMKANKFNPGIHSTDVVTSSAIKFIKEYNDDKPFYLNVAYLAPHDPRVVPQKYLDMYADVDIELQENYSPTHPFLFGQENERDEILAPKPLSDKWIKQELKSYYAMITHLDDEIGNLLEELENSGYEDETLVIFTSDNGLSLGAHGLIGKQSLYEESVRVPMIIAGPGIMANTVNNNFVLLQDIFPTVMEYLELNAPDLDGVSFAGGLYGEDYNAREELYLGFTHLIRAVKNKKHKLIQYRPNQGEEIHQLFDLTIDPYEKVNVYNDANYSEVVAQMSQLLKEQSEIYECYENEFTKQYWNKA